MLTFCLRPPEHKGPNFELASPLSILHDHPYDKFQHTDKGWKHVVAKGWASNSLSLTPQDLVCKRNGYMRNSEKKKSVVVEMDKTIHGVSVGWPYIQRQERSAKFLARLKIKDNCSTEKEVARFPTKKKKLSISRAQKMKPVKKLSGGSVHNLKSPKTVIATVLPTAVPISPLAPYGMSSSLKKLLPNVPPSIIAQARKCTVGITPTKPFISPAQGQHFVFPPPTSPSTEKDSPSTCTHQLKPFSISVKKLPLSLMPISSSRVEHVTNSKDVQY